MVYSPGVFPPASLTTPHEPQVSAPVAGLGERMSQANTQTTLAWKTDALIERPFSMGAEAVGRAAPLYLPDLNDYPTSNLGCGTPVCLLRRPVGYCEVVDDDAIPDFVSVRDTVRRVLGTGARWVTTNSGEGKHLLSCCGN